MTPRTWRLLLVLAILLAMVLVAWFIIKGLNENISLYYTPSQLTSSKVSKGIRMRFGGYVKPGTKQQLPNLAWAFVITDGKADLSVIYQGVLPDLFREGQGVVASGYLNAQNVLIADQLFVKHEAGYTPPVLPTGEQLLKQGPEKALKKLFGKEEKEP